MLPFIVIAVVVVIILTVAIVVVARRRQTQADPLAERLAELATRDTPTTLEELELSVPFSERILIPIIERLGTFVVRFTPKNSLIQIQKMLDKADNPKPWTPVSFYAVRLVVSVG